jgi:hypothetical protein
MATKKRQPKDKLAESKTQRRILQFLNAARAAQDLMELPEHQMAEPMVEHGIDGPDIHEPVEEKPREKLFDRAQAEKILRARDEASPLYGFSNFDQVRHLLGEEIRRFTDRIHWFSGATYGDWSAPQPLNLPGPGPIFSAVHAAVLRTGLVLLIERACNRSVSRTPLWNPTTRALNLPPPPPPADNLYCSGHSFLSDGRLLVVGGGGEYQQTVPPNMSWMFDPGKETWDRTRDASNNPTYMTFDRWYPTTVSLGYEPGRVVVASGRPYAGSATPIMEIYSEATGTYSNVSTPADKQFVPTYPGLHLLPGGEIFFAPVGFRESMEMPADDLTNEPSAYFTFAAANSGQWTNLGANDRTKGMSVLLLDASYPFVRVLTVGGGNATRATTYRLINLSTLSPAWGAEIPLPTAPGQMGPTTLIHPNLVLLPDGTVFVCGGSVVGEPCWLYNPTALTWSQMDALTYERRYHSVAVLLPTGEVMTTGGEGTTGADTVEVFSPPYLFGGARATITSVTPSPIHHGQAFTIQTPDAADIAKVTLVRPMAVTHQTDSEQRVIQLPFTQSGANSLSATAPDGWHPHALAPRGWYMLFILNANGVPSIAQFVQLH